MSNRKNLKRCMSGITGRRMRKENTVSIRKAKKEDGYKARRNMAAAAKADKYSARSKVMKNLADRAQSLLIGIQVKNDLKTQSKALQAFVLIMSSGVPSLFDEEDGQHVGLWQTIMAALPYFVKVLDYEGQVQMQVDAAFALRFVASMDRSHFIIVSGGLLKLVKLMKSHVVELKMQAAWCLGNICSESAACCVEVLKVYSPVEVLTHLSSVDGKLQRAAVWLLRSMLDHPVVISKWNKMDKKVVFEMTDQLTKLLHLMVNKAEKMMQVKENDAIVAPWRMFEMKTGKDAPNDIAVVRYVSTVDKDTVKVADLDVNFSTGQNEIYIVKVAGLTALESIEDDEEEVHEVLDQVALTICDACWGLVETSIASSDATKLMVERNTCTVLVQLLQLYHSPILCSPIIRLFENIISADDTYIDVSIQSGVIPILPRLLFNPSKIVREETCWFMSNIAAGTAQHASLLMEQPHLMVRIAELLAWAEYDVRREAAWVVCNLSVHANEHYIPSLVQLGILDSFGCLLAEHDPQIVLLVLEAIERILNVNPEQNAILVDESDCIEKIEQLCYYENEQISNGANLIMETYFSNEAVHTTTNESSFQFNPPIPTKPFQF